MENPFTFLCTEIPLETLALCRHVLCTDYLNVNRVDLALLLNYEWTQMITDLHGGFVRNSKLPHTCTYESLFDADSQWHTMVRHCKLEMKSWSGSDAVLQSIQRTIFTWTQYCTDNHYSELNKRLRLMVVLDSALMLPSFSDISSKYKKKMINRFGYMESEAAC